MLPDKLSRLNFRYSMVCYALEYGISACARHYSTTRKTVQLWVRRYDGQVGKESLSNQSRVGQEHPLKLPAGISEAIVAYRQKMKNLVGARVIAEHLNLTCSVKTVHKILKQNGLVRKQPKTWQKRKDMSAVRAQYRPFEKIQMDIKYLQDIPEIYPAYVKGDIPRFMISARDYKTGWLFLAFTNRLDAKSTGIYANYLIQRLKTAGVDLSHVSIQTDNGREFVDRLKNRTTLFQNVLHERVCHKVIPPASPTFNSDVETYHKLVENEFLKLEDFINFPDFISKAYLYMLYFNFFRKNRNRGNKSPVQLLAEDRSDINPIGISFPPILCDYYYQNPLAITDPVYFKGLPLTSLIII